MTGNSDLTKSQKKLLEHAKNARSEVVGRKLRAAAKNPDIAKHVLKGWERGKKKYRRGPNV